MAQNDARDVGVLPEGWVWIDFTDSTSVVSTTGRKVKQRDYMPSGKLPVIDQGQGLIGGYTSDMGKCVECELPVIIFGDHTKTLKFVDFDFAAGADGIKVIKPFAAFDPKLFFYFLHHLDLPDRGYSRHFQFLRKEALPLPPFPEQHRIVAEIETQFTRQEAGVAALKRAQANLRRYKASVLQAACEGRLVPTEAELARAEGRDYEPAEVLLERILAERRAKWEAENPGKKYKEPDVPGISELPELPEGWVWASTGELCDCIVPNRDKPKTFSGNIPWITLPDFDDNNIQITGSRSGLGLSKQETEKYRAKVIPKGSVVMSCVGRFGISAVLGEEAVINQQLHAFLITDNLVAKYLAYAIKTQVSFMEQISTATTITYLNKSKCNSVPIALPPLSEQRRIVAEVERQLSVMRELEKQVEAALRRADRLRQAILKHAFEGKLVPQDPDDEPASVLLERIKAERAGQTGEGPRYRKAEQGKPEQLTLL